MVEFGLTAAFSSLNSGRILPSPGHLSVGISMRISVINSSETRISCCVPKFETIQSVHLSVVNEISGKAEELCICST